MSFSSDDPFVFFVMMLILGLTGFFRGFILLRKKRMIENIPTSSIHSMAMGTVEISGSAQQYKSILSAPFTGNPCVYYKYKIEEERNSGKNSHWVTIAKGDSHNYPFFVNDGTGKVLVDPDKAEMVLPHDLCTYKWDHTPYLSEFLYKNNLYEKGFLGLRIRRRFTEWHIREGEKVYLLGYAQKDPQFEQKHLQLMRERLDALKNDKLALKQFDMNNDGEITQDEWTLAVKHTDQAMMERYMEERESNENFNTVITYNPNMKIFLISDKSQKDLLSMLGMQVILFVWGGGALAIAGLYLILGRLGLL